MPATVSSFITSQAKARPDAIALLFEQRATSYAVLERLSNQIAWTLIAAGIRPGDRIAHLAKNSDRYFALLAGAMKARVILVPLNWRLADAELGQVIGDSSPRMLFVGPEYLARGQALASAAGLERAIALEGSGGDGMPALMELLDSAPSHAPELPLAAEDVVLIMYTSGTTGRPKGVMLTHRSILRTGAPEAAADPDWFTWRAGESALIAMPVFHIGGTGQGLRALRGGCTAVVLREFDPQQVLEALVRHRVSKLFVVPAAIRVLLGTAGARTLDYSALKYVLYGASPIPLTLLREALDVFRCGFVQMYGSTETSGTVVALGPEDHCVEGSTRMLSAGRCLPGVEVEIRDANGRALATGDIGEIFVRSSANMSGYWGLAQVTAEVLDERGWLRTGDAGYLDAEGYLYIHDRIKDMIISGGENIYPAEVEAAISGHPAVAEVAVIGVPSERWGEEVTAVVVPKPGLTPDARSLLDWARSRIAGYKVPKSVVFAERLPRNATGKLLRRELRERYWGGQARRVH